MKMNSMQLTMSHVGLGELSESALMVIMGDAHSLFLTNGLSITPDQIKNQEGVPLYPAYFMTHMIVPPSLLINQYKLWDQISIGVEVKKFGDTILDSTYVVGNGLEKEDRTWEDNNKSYIFMNANSLFVVDATVDKNIYRRVAVPKVGCIADLEKIAKPPISINHSRQIRTEGFKVDDKYFLSNNDPIVYKVVPGKDTSPGHAMIFSKFVEIMDYSEFVLLTQMIKPGISINIYNHLNLLERETYYYGNCFEGDTLDIYLKGWIDDCPEDYHGSEMKIISAGILNFVIEIYQQRNNALLSIAKAKKLISIPTQFQDLVQDIRRLVGSYS